MSDYNDRDWKELEDIGKADRSEWERTVVENKALLNDLHLLQAKFKLPIEGQAFWDFLDNAAAKKVLLDEIVIIIKKHGVDPKWEDSIVNYCVEGYFAAWCSLGYPEGHIYLDEKKDFTILPETLIRNPIIQDYIQEDRDKMPPQPAPFLNENSRWEYDWRPVWEWEKRHPAQGEKTKDRRQPVGMLTIPLLGRLEPCYENRLGREGHRIT